MNEQEAGEFIDGLASLFSPSPGSLGNQTSDCVAVLAK